MCLISRIFLVLPGRIELTTSPLPRECSTTELRQQDRGRWLLFTGATEPATRADAVQGLVLRRMTQNCDDVVRISRFLLAPLRAGTVSGLPVAGRSGYQGADSGLERP